MLRASDILLNAYRSVDYVEHDDPRKEEKLWAIASLYRAWLMCAAQEDGPADKQTAHPG